MNPQAAPWLFVSYGGGHVKALLPVARRARELGLAQPVYLALTTAAAEARAAGLQVLGFRDLLQPGDEAALRRGEELAAALAIKAADHEESVAYLGLSYADLETRVGEEAAALAYARFGRQAFLPRSVLERALDRVQPALVLVTNSPRAERAAIEVARARGIPALCLLDLFGQWERAVLAQAAYGDMLCVLNEAVRQSFIAAGRPAASVQVTGNPAFDALADASLHALGHRWRAEAGWDGLQVLLYASSPEPQHSPGVEREGDPLLPRRIEHALVQAVQANPRLALWVRRPPSEGPPDEIIALGHPRIRASGPGQALPAMLHACDEVVVTVSTVGVEARIAGRRVSQVRGSILDELSPYLAMGIADRELTLADLKALQPLPAARLGAEPEAGADATARVLSVARALVASGQALRVLE